ncbi:MAG: FadR/GntR family transcriptional regulator [Beutenbergiaceae bacterium]
MPEQDGWEPVRRQRTYEQVIARIEDQILDGRLRVGDRLPAEREFAHLLGVSRPSLRESLRVLEALGIVEVRLGGEGGTFLSSKVSSGFVNVMKLQHALAYFSSDNIVEARLALEEWSCGEAARRRQSEDLADLSAILDDMERPEIAVAEFNRLDTAFHIRIASATNNSLVAQLMDSLRLLIQRSMVERYSHLPDWRQTAKTVQHEHRDILAAINSQDRGRAASLVRDHIESFWFAADHPSRTDTAPS